MLKAAGPLLLCAGLLSAASAPAPYAKLLHVRVPMRDNVRLDTNVFHPSGNGRFPTVLMRTPYGKGPDLPLGYQSFINHGYAVVMQDVRGRYGSGGVFDVVEPGRPGRLRHAELDCGAALVGRQSGNDRRLVRRDRAVARGAAEQSASQGDFSGGFRIGRIFRPLLFRGRSNEAGPSFVVDVGEPHALLGARSRNSRITFTTFRCAPSIAPQRAGRRVFTRPF